MTRCLRIIEKGRVGFRAADVSGDSGLGFRGNPDWKHGMANWTIDYPVSDRHLSAEIRRLTRMHARSVEQPIDLEDATTCSIIRVCMRWRWVMESH